MFILMVFVNVSHFFLASKSDKALINDRGIFIQLEKVKKSMVLYQDKKKDNA